MAQTESRTTTTTGEALAVVAICFGLFMWSSAEAVAGGFPAEEGSFSTTDLLELMATELFLGSVALVMLARRGYSVASLVPRPTLAGTGWGVGLAAVDWLVYLALIDPLLGGLGPQPMDVMMRGPSAPLEVVLPMAALNASFEEVFLLGFLMRGLRKHGLSIALGVPVLVRVVYHLYQGPVGAVAVYFTGLVFGLYYARTGKLWAPVVAHAVLDIAPFVLSRP